MFGADDLTVNGRTVIGAEAYALVQALGEPNEVQTLPAGGGRILLYDGAAAVRLGLDEATGAEVVLGVTATGIFRGRVGCWVGMAAREAAGLSDATRTYMHPAGRSIWKERPTRAAVCRNERGKRWRGDDPLPLPDGKRRGRAAGRGHSRGSSAIGTCTRARRRTVSDERFILKNARHLAARYMERFCGWATLPWMRRWATARTRSFLCELVGETGRVYAFDVQEEALERTAARLEAAGLRARATLILAGHETMKENVRFRRAR